MLIDWFTVGAQGLNFLILVWLMKRFLYRPILDAIDAREKLVAAQLASAAAQEARAVQERDEFENKNRDFDRQRSALLVKAEADARTERERLIDEARAAADVLSAKRQEALSTEARNFSQALARRTQEEVFAITRKTLADLAGADFEEQLCQVFTRRLRELNGPAREELSVALGSTSAGAVVRSAFELPADKRASIQKSLSEIFSVEVPLHFETAPDLVSGIELTTNGRRVAWTIAAYIASMEERVSELLKQAVPAPK